MKTLLTLIEIQYLNRPKGLLFLTNTVAIWRNISNFQTHFYSVSNFYLHSFSVIVKSMNVLSQTRVEINYLSYFGLNQKFQSTH
jgi:hypothetical protein